MRCQCMTLTSVQQQGCVGARLGTDVGEVHADFDFASTPQRASLHGPLITYRHNADGSAAGGLKTLARISDESATASKPMVHSDASTSKELEPPFSTPGYADYLRKTGARKNHERRQTWSRAPTPSSSARMPGYGAFAMGYPYEQEMERVSGVERADQKVGPLIRKGFSLPKSRIAEQARTFRLDSTPRHVAKSTEFYASRMGDDQGRQA